MPFDPARAIADLRAIAELTGGHGTGGARRVCWTDEWVKARAYVHDQLAATGAEIDRDEAGNVWAYLRGLGRRHGDRRLPRRLRARGRLAGRRARHRRRARGAARDGAEAGHAAVHRRVRRLRGRGGRPLRPQPVRLLRRVRLPGAGGARRPARPRRQAPEDVLRAYGVEIERRARGAATAWTAPAPTSSCTSSRARCSRPRASPSARCSAPSASSASARTSPARPRTPARRRSASGATRSSRPRAPRSSCARSRCATTASARSAPPTCTPGVVTAVPGRTEILRRPAPPRRRHAGDDEGRVLRGAERLAAEEGCTVEIEQIWRIEPIPFDQGLIDIASTRDPRGHRHRPQAAVRPAARRGGGGPHRRADGDDLLLVDERHQPREGGGHADRAPRAGAAGVRHDGRTRDPRSGLGGLLQAEVGDDLLDRPSPRPAAAAWRGRP